jgi:hypothetical protein
VARAFPCYCEPDEAYEVVFLEKKRRKSSGFEYPYREDALLKIAFEVDFDLGLRAVGAGFEAPAFDCVLCSGGKQRMAGFDLGFRDGAVGLNGDHENHSSAYVHAAGKLGIAGGDASHYGAMNIAGKGGSGAEEETSYEEKRTGRSD